MGITLGHVSPLPIRISGNMQFHAASNLQCQSALEPGLDETQNFGAQFLRHASRLNLRKRRQRDIPGSGRKRFRLTQEAVCHWFTIRPALPACAHDLDRICAFYAFLNALQCRREEYPGIDFVRPILQLFAQFQHIIAHFFISSLLANRIPGLRPITISGGLPVIAAIWLSMDASWRLYSAMALSRRGSSNGVSLTN